MSIAEIVPRIFDIDRLQVYVRVREAMQTVLEEKRVACTDTFKGTHLEHICGGFLGSVIVKLRPQTIAIVSWGDGRAGYGIDGKPRYASKPNCITEKKSVCQWVGYDRVSRGGEFDVILPHEINVEIVSGTDVSRAVFYACTDGLLEAPGHALRFDLAITEGIHSVSGVMERTNEYQRFLDRVVSQRDRDDRTMVAVSGAWFL